MKRKFHNQKMNAVMNVFSKPIRRTILCMSMCLFIMSNSDKGKGQSDRFVFKQQPETPVITEGMQTVTGTIRGQVRKGSVVAHGVVVHLYMYNTSYSPDSLTSVVTDNKGYFEFNLLDLGEYELRVDSTKGPGGYAEYIEEIIVAREPVYPRIDLVTKERAAQIVYFNAMQVVGRKTNIKLCQTSTCRTTKAEDTKKRGIRGFGGLNKKRKDKAFNKQLKTKGYFKSARKKRVSNLRYQEIARKPFRERNRQPENVTQETYSHQIENTFKNPFNEPLSTFSIDVDNASYTNIRRMLEANQRPPVDAVRIEEFINYFDYDYKGPDNNDPFAIHLEAASCPWNKDTRLVHIAIKGKEMHKDALPPSNLVFLVDVSGSMSSANKLPLVKQSLKVLVEHMREQDRIAIVTYAGAAGLALPSTSCADKVAILGCLDRLEAGGSTAGGEGLRLAYKVAAENFMKSGNNRIILATDGDFNVGVSSDWEMKTLVESKSKSGIFMTVCGFGMGNYKDSKLELIADFGNGNYYYIDNINEANKVFSSRLTGTLMTIAKDVKIQVEFNPALVKAYRLIGYENRILKTEDFKDDKKDAGELGAGHTVTALYEIVPVGSEANISGFDETDTLYFTKCLKPGFEAQLLNVKLRYKQPAGFKSILIEKPLLNTWLTYQQASNNFRFASGVAVFGMLLRNSQFKGDSDYRLAASLVESAGLNESSGYKTELIGLIKKASGLASR